MRSDFLFPLVDLGVPISDAALEDLGALLDPAVIAEYVAYAMAEAQKDKTWQYARANFKNENGDPWEMSPGELALFKFILFRQHPRGQVITPTQYGKSITTARALLCRITTFPEEWLLLVPDTKRGRIIIKYMIHDTSENPYFTDKLFGLKTDNDLLMRLLEEKSKVKLTYQITKGKRQYGSLEILTTDARRKQNAITSVMGFGGRNIVADESALTDDEIDAGVFRMMAGKGADTFLLKIGNPFFRNHFLTTWKDPTYKKVFINYIIGLAEGRYERSFLEEARKKPQFSVLYGCAFPQADAIDSEGWMPLMTDEEVRLAMQPGVHFGEQRLGIDVADEGINESVIVHRSMGYAEVPFAESGIDPMGFVGQVMVVSGETKVRRMYVDRVGVGAGSYSRLQEVNRTDHNNTLVVFGVNAGEQAAEPARFFNKRAEMYWRVREWLKQGGKLSNDARWYQLAKIKYKATSRGSIQIMPKDLMRKQGVQSPDVADALSLTFYDDAKVVQVSEEDRFFLRKMEEQKRKDKRRARPQFAIGRPR